jgi:hypothetical protein
MNYTQLVSQINAYTENQFGDDSTGSPEVDTFIKQAEQRIYNTIEFPSLRKNVTGITIGGNKYLSAPTDFLAVFSMAIYPYASTTGTKITNTTMQVASAVGIIVGSYVSGTGITSGTTVTAVNGTTITVSLSLSGFTSGAVVFEGDYEYLLNKDVNFIRSAFPNPNDQDIPQYYAVFGPTTTNAVPPVITNELSFILGPTPDDAYGIELHYYYYPESIVTAQTTWLGDNFDSVLLYGTLLEAYTYLKGEPDVYAAYQKRYDEAVVLAKRLGDGMERGDAYRDGQIKQKVM